MVVFVRVGGTLLLLFMWLPVWLPRPGDRPVPRVFEALLGVASVVVLLWMRRLRQVWFDGSSFTIRDWFLRPVEVPKAHLVKVRAVPLKLAWVTLTFDPPTAYGAAVRVLPGPSGQSEQFQQFADRMKAIAEKRPANKPVAVPNDKAIEVRGWSKPELEQIIGDFGALYNIPDLPVTLAVSENGTVTLRFPSDLEPRLFVFLVNYLHYPEHVAIGSRTITAHGSCTLTPEFQLPNRALVGKRATFFAPPHDTEFDFVVATLDAGASYRIPFTTLHWSAVDPMPGRT